MLAKSCLDYEHLARVHMQIWFLNVAIRILFLQLYDLPLKRERIDVNAGGSLYIVFITYFTQSIRYQ